MHRFSRINIIWRKELLDILRDRRTIFAMVLVPIVLYPALMLGSLQAFELQNTRLTQETYTVAVRNEEMRRWLRRVIDTDVSRRTALAEGRPVPADEPPPETPPAPATASDAEQPHAGVRHTPPPFEIVVVGDLNAAVESRRAYAALDADAPPAGLEDEAAWRVTIVMDQTEIRSEKAALGLQGVLERFNDQTVRRRLERARLQPTFITPIEIAQHSVATPERVGGSILGQIVPLILIVMTITGAIYPAIDLTAGERERGTLETLMVAPVPTVDLVAGKFIVVTLIALICAFLNLLSIGGTIYLGGLGELLARGNAVVIPLSALPLVLVVLIPLAVMFSAVLLAVCSFARSFKEAQNYVMPVMVAAMVPAVVGVLPGTRLEGPLMIMPVANIVVLTRELFMGRFDLEAIVWVMLSTSVYAAAAVAVAARLFGQEAVLFADSGSFKTIFQRRFFKARATPTASQALLLLAIVYPLNFFVQRALTQSGGLTGSVSFLYSIALTFVILFVFFPLAAAQYTRLKLATTFSLKPPPLAAVLAAMCFGLSTWVLVQAWVVFQQGWLPMPEVMRSAGEDFAQYLAGLNPVLVILILAVVPAFCEEFFFRGFALSGLRGLGKVTAVLVVAAAFAIYHQSVHRLIITFALGNLLGLLVIRWGSIWPAMIAHLLHNTLIVSVTQVGWLRDALTRVGFMPDEDRMPPLAWMLVAGLLLAVGLMLAAIRPRETPTQTPSDIEARVSPV